VRYWERWDVDEATDKALDKIVLTHSTSGGIPEVLDAMFNTGGEATSTTGRIRKGINLSATGGMSASADIQTGGASYFFTRIRKKGSSNSQHSGLFFKGRLLKRADAVSYDSDRFGRIDGQQAQRAKTIAEALANAGGSDETLFKEGLSLIDDIDFIQVNSEEVRKKTLAVFAKHGVTHMGDGRPVADVVKTYK
jgi:hypothetical protein